MKFLSNSKVLGANNEYVQQTKDYGRIDALFALILYSIIMSMSLIMGKIFSLKNSSLTETYTFYASGIFSLVSIGLVFLFCLIRKQKLTTVGFSKSKAIRSFLMGIILILIIFILWGIRPIISGLSIKEDITLITMKIIYYLIFIAFMEELVFRGYIGTRLYGFFKNKSLSIAVVGIMFTLSHIPFQIMVSQMSLLEFISVNFSNLLNNFIHHLIRQWLYSKYNSIIAPTFLHFIENFIRWFIV